MIEFIRFLVIWAIISGVLFICVKTYMRHIEKNVVLVLKRYNAAKKANLSFEEMKEIL